MPGWSKKELFESFAGGWYKCVSDFPDVINVFLLILFDNEDGDDDDDEVDRQLVRMGYRFLVRGCKGL